MNITDLENSGGFVSEQGEKRTVKWAGKTGEVFVRAVSFGAISATQALPDAERNEALVRECIRLGDGTEQLTREQVARLHPALAAELLKAITEVNALGAEGDDPNA